MFTRRVQWSAAVLAAALLGGCAELGPTDGTGDGTPTDPGSTTPPPLGPGDLGSRLCNLKLSVKPDGPALIVRDPAVLSRFPLKKVLQQLIDGSPDPGAITPEQLVQQLFDTENSEASAVFPGVMHCDTAGNAAFKNGAPVGCPRAEGALAKSAGLLVPDDPDYFAPVALVNRFDLTSTSAQTCGEYRIIYAKWSGRSDPDDRLFLIFEGALKNPMPGNVMACWPAVNAWAELEQQSDPEQIAGRLEAFYFTGLPGFLPLVHPQHFGFLSNDDDPYGSSRGQVRLSQRMQDPWEMRELHLMLKKPGAGGPPIFFAPATAKNSLVPGLFSPANQSVSAVTFRGLFPMIAVQTLGAAALSDIRLSMENTFNAGESALTGPAAASYQDQMASGDSAKFMADLQQQIDNLHLNDACPSGDPLTPADIVNRAAVLSCAGCHAPQNVLGPAQKLGCGLTWPSSLGEAHIDEKGNLSPALTDVLLPRRASVMTTYLQACDMSAIQRNLQPSSDKVIPK